MSHRHTHSSARIYGRSSRRVAALASVAVMAGGLLAATPVAQAAGETCSSASFTTSGSCTVAAGDSIDFTIKGGNGGQGGSGGAGGFGGNANGPSTLYPGGMGGAGGAGGLGGPGAKVSGTITNDSGADMVLTIVVGQDGSPGTAGREGMPGEDVDGAPPQQATGGGKGQDGRPGGAGSPSSITIAGQATALIIAQEGAGGAGGGGGGGGGGGATTSDSEGAAGAGGTAGSNGAAGDAGGTEPSPLPSGWTELETTASEAPQVVFGAAVPASAKPSAPRDVAATATLGGATLSWAEPETPGESAVSDYEATSTPAGGTCLVKAPARACDISGLSAGVSYTFTVRAKNDAGWGPASAASNAIVPLASASIVIAGMRDRNQTDVIMVDGRTTGIAVGATVTPFVKKKGEKSYSKGVGTRTVGEDESFLWQRKSRKSTSVYFTSGSVKSNVVIIPSR